MSGTNRDGERDFGSRQAAKYGMVGALLGAIVGAVASFSGTFWTLQMQADMEAKATKRTAFGEYLADAEMYRRQLITLKEAVQSEDQGRYERERAALFKASADVYASSTVVYLVGDDAVDQVTIDLNAALFEPNEPTLLEDYDIARLDAALDAGPKLMSEFLGAAQADMDDE